MREYQLFIDGEPWASTSGEVVDDVNPATGVAFARVHWAAVEDVERAISGAHRAFESWAKTLPGERERILMHAADVVEQERDALVGLLTEEAGSTFGKAMLEIQLTLDVLRSAAGECRRIFGDTMPSNAPGKISMTVRRPLGVIACIAPFNLPLFLAMKKVALALAAGNTVVLKPSESTPISGLEIAEIFRKSGLPKGVLNVVPGAGAPFGEQIMRDPRVRMVTFTGSTQVGRLLAEQAGKHMKKVSLELGGKNPVLVLADADIEYAVRVAAFGAFAHQGQVCMAGSKLIVEAPIYDAFCDKLVAKARGLKVGDPRQPDTVIGPLIRPSQCARVAAHIKDAERKGARLLTGGACEGNFFQPTVLADVKPGMQVYDEETFGPVVSVIRASDAEDALRYANDTRYGLSSAVITRDLQRALDLSLRIEAGMVHINDSPVLDEPHVPFGGVKDSGFGREGGRYSMEEMTEVKWITVQLGQARIPF